MNIKDMICTIMEQDLITRSSYHLTLGELIEELEKDSPENTLVFSDDASYVGKANIYRGYYRDLAFSSSSTVKSTVGEVLERAKEALNKTFYGYEGGEYTMKLKTPLWKSAYGKCSNLGIMGYNKDQDVSLLVVKFIHD